MKRLTDIPSEYKCHQNFYRMVWGDLTCKECGNKGLLFRKTYEYCPHCKKKYSVKADTSLFKFCNLSFRQIYALIWCWQHKCSIGEIRNILGLSYPTVSNWLRKLRSHLPVSREVLDGTCEVDGSFMVITNFLYLGTSGKPVITLLASLVQLIILRSYLFGIQFFKLFLIYGATSGLAMIACLIFSKSSSLKCSF